MPNRMIAEHEAGALSWVYREIRFRLGLGGVPNVFKAMAAVNGDVLIQNWTAFRQTLLEGALPRTLKEMIGVIVSRRQGSECAMRMHVQSLQMLGIRKSVIARLILQGDCEELSATARAALHFALLYLQNGENASIVSALAAGLSEDEVQEVIDTVLMVDGLSRFSLEAGIPSDGGNIEGELASDGEFMKA